jgi:NDP-sugar pyrophosphorylase family protein
MEAHRDMFDGRYRAGLFTTADASKPIVSPDARIEEGARLEPPCFVDSGAHIKAGAAVGPYSVIGRGVVLEEESRVSGSIIWPNTRVGQHAEVDGAIVGRNCHIGRYATVRAPAVLGDKTSLTDYSKV